jgi:hypothetical protein
LPLVIRDLVYEQIERCRLARLTIDLDGTVLRTGAKVDGAERGFNHNAAGFLRGLFADLRARFGHRLPIELRMDGAFFHPEILAFLDEERVDYAVKVPIWKWLGLLPVIAARRRWTPVDAYVEGFATTLHLERWGRTEQVVVYRKRVRHETRKNFQLDLFSPDDGHFEYSAMASNQTLGISALWHFMAGRGAHEKTLSELKSQLAFEAIPTNDRTANAAWQLLSTLTLNLVRGFQIDTGAARRPHTLKRTFAYVLQSPAPTSQSRLARTTSARWRRSSPATGRATARRSAGSARPCRACPLPRRSRYGRASGRLRATAPAHSQRRAACFRRDRASRRSWCRGARPPAPGAPPAPGCHARAPA